LVQLDWSLTNNLGVRGTNWKPFSCLHLGTFHTNYIIFRNGWNICNFFLESLRIFFICENWNF
jgi:hypothetical protein